MKLFHCAPIRLRAGSIIEPGRFGWFLKRINPQARMRIQEELFEAARAEAFPGTVSRCNCIFAFESEAALDAFIGERNLAYERYEIRPADGSPPLEARDLDIMDDVVRHVENKAVPLNIPWIVQQALRYYGQEPPRSGRYELLIEGAVEIVRRLDT